MISMYSSNLPPVVLGVTRRSIGATAREGSIHHGTAATGPGNNEWHCICTAGPQVRVQYIEYLFVGDCREHVDCGRNMYNSFMFCI